MRFLSLYVDPGLEPSNNGSLNSSEWLSIIVERIMNLACILENLYQISSMRPFFINHTCHNFTLCRFENVISVAHWRGVERGRPIDLVSLDDLC